MKPGTDFAINAVLGAIIVAAFVGFVTWVNSQRDEPLIEDDLAAEHGQDVWDDRAHVDVAVHDVARDYLTAAAEQDWPRVHQLTARDHRPHDRQAWLDGRPSGFTDKCAGDPAGRPAIDVVTLSAGPDRYLVEATVWVQSNQGLTCRYEVLRDAGQWRVGTNVPRAATS